MKNLKIKKIFDIIDRSIFMVNSTLDYKRTVEAIILLANVIKEEETDESIWSIGEFGNTTLDSLLIGAYWFFSDYYNGMFSDEYKALCAIGKIFSPGMSHGPEKDSSEEYVYQGLKAMFEKE